MINIKKFIEIVCNLKPGLAIIREDQRPEKVFAFLNKDQLRTDIRKSLFNIFFGNGFNAEKIEMELRCNWYIVTDLDGLRAVNSLGNHAKGDILIFRVCQTLKESPKINNFCKEHGLDVKLIREGGDEFSMLIKSTSFLLAETGALVELKKIIQREINNIDVKDLLDLSLENFRENFSTWGISQQALELLKEIGEYAFTPSASGGITTFFEASEYFYFENIDNIHNLSIEEALDGIMGKVLDLAEEKMKMEKYAVRKRLRESDNPNKRFTAYILSRNDETKGQLEEITKLTEKNLTWEERDLKREESFDQLRKLANHLLDRLIQGAHIETTEEAESIRKKIEMED